MSKKKLIISLIVVVFFFLLFMFTREKEIAGVTIEEDKMTINEAGVILEGVKIDTLVVADTVGDGEVYIRNSEVNTLIVNGGGLNSVEVDNTKVGTLLSDRKDNLGVRILLRNSSFINDAKIVHKTVLETADETSAVKHLVVEGEEEITTVILKSIKVEEFEAMTMTELFTTEDVGQEENTKVRVNNIEQESVVVSMYVDEELISEQVVSSFEDISFPRVEKEGFKFIGWTYDNQEFTEALFGQNVILVATFEEEVVEANLPTYTISFDTNGGDNIDAVKILEGKSLTDIATPVRKGYVFLGWTYEGKGYDLSNKVLKDMTLVAKWGDKAVTYEVKFIDPDGNLIKAVEVESGEVVSGLNYDSSDTLKFQGWYELGSEYPFEFNHKIYRNYEFHAKVIEFATLSFDSNGGTKIDSYEVAVGYPIYLDKDPVKFGYEFEGWYLDGKKVEPGFSISSSQTLHAKWVEESNVEMITLRFNPNNGEMWYEVEIEKGSTYEMPTHTEPNKEFRGWYNIHTSERYSSSTVFSEDTELTADWYEKEMYSVVLSIYDNDTDKYNVYKEVKVEKGETYNLPNPPAREGYIFEGWYNASTKLGSSVVVTEQMGLDGRWKKIIYHNVTLVNENADEASRVIEVKDKEFINLPVPKIDGYRFKGWFNGDSEVDTYQEIDGSLTFRAKWEKIIYKNLTLDSGTGTKVKKEEQNTVINLSELSRDNYRFLGWKVNGEGSFVTSVKLDEDKTVVAFWVEQVTVAFNSEGGTSYDNQVIDINTSISLPTPEKTDHRFLGWVLAGTKVGSSMSFSSNTTLTAKWEEIEYVVINFDSTGGSTPETIRVEKGTTISNLPDSSKAGHSFEGWQLSGSDVSSSNYLASSDVTLVATWEPLIKVTFNMNGGTPHDDKEIKHDQRLSLGTPTKTDLRFVGWFIGEENIGFEVYRPNGPENITVEARWEEITYYTVTVLKPFSEEVDSTVRVEAGEFANITAPHVEGYRLSTWYNRSTSVMPNTVTMPFKVTGDTILKPTYDLDVTEVTLYLDSKGGTHVENITVAPGETFTIPVPTRDGYKFLGWYTGQCSLEGEKMSLTTSIMGPMGACAIWEEE